MTKKEKFFQAIDQFGAKRVTEFGWANIPDQNVWVAYRNKDVHIFSQPDGDEYFDHYIIGAEQCHWNNMVLCDIIYLTDLDGNDQPLCEDERILLRTFATDDESLSDEETMHAIFLLWYNCDSITNSISKTGWSQHGDYKDDVEDGSELLALNIEQLSIASTIVTLFQMAERAGLGYYQDENSRLVFFNANNVERADDDEEADIYDTSHAYSTDIQPCWWTERDGFNIKNNKQ